LADSAIAAILVQTGQPLEMMEVSFPRLKPGQMIVDVAYSGVCQTQLNEARGHKGPDRFLPHTLGHEGSGVVREVGPDVTKVKPGDRVVLSWLKGTGLDVPGTLYQGAIGKINSGAISTFMTATVTCENRVTKIPYDMPLKEAALLGCAIPTGAGVVLNSIQLRRGQSLAVFGVGGIGLSAVMAASALDGGPIIAIDVTPEKLALAKSLGATHTINPLETDPVAAVRELTGGQGVDAALEAAGNTEVMELAFESVRNGGGVCFIAGNAPYGRTLRVNPFSLIAGKSLKGTWGGDGQIDVDIPRYVKMFNDGRLALNLLAKDVYGLPNINKALDDLEAHKVARAMIDMGSGIA
jgi:S-(hydroxymethyl)glutathione dehydrogenase / alcohol dehydrogenase